MPDTYSKPVPMPQPESDHYWDQAKNGKLVFQKCNDCDSVQFYPRVLCTACSSRSLDWIESSGRGTLFTFSIVHVAPHPGFREDLPFITAIVELEEGVKMPSQVIGIEPDPELLHIGMQLEVAFEEITDSISLPKFRPAK